MNTITFRNIIPHVFATQTDLHSDIWASDVTFQKGHLYLVEAASGRGKSTFCSYILGYRDDYNGTLLFDQTDTRQLKPNDWTNIRRGHISMLFQELRLFPELTAMENVEIKNNLTNAVTNESINAWFERLGIADKKHALIGQMSFGQQQRVALMRALAQPYDFIILDEPISHLDDHNANIMGSMVMEDAKRKGAGVIMTSIGKHINLEYEKVIRL